MSVGTSIEWTDTTWNPVRGCSRVSEGCRNCYAERFAARFSGTFVTEQEGRRVEIDKDDATLRRSPFKGFAEMRDFEGPRWTGKVELVPEKLAEPLGWKKPRRVFVNSMSDLFHEALSREAIAAVFGTMIRAHWHTFQVLTKRPARMREVLATLTPSEALAAAGVAQPDVFRRPLTKEDALSAARNWPPPNIWLGVSVEDQASADERIPHLLATPAQVRFISAEPLLGPVDLTDLAVDKRPGSEQHFDALDCDVDPVDDGPFGGATLDWVIVGGESGPGARPCDAEWVRSIVRQCQEAGAAVFVKQLGARPICGLVPSMELLLEDRKGGDPAEWPEDLRVREFPEPRPADRQSDGVPQ